MLKKILIGVGVIIVICFAAYMYMMSSTKSHSPQDTAVLSVGGLDLKIVYCQPFKKGRVIFGDKNSGALQPDGQYWRLGANDATEITFSTDVNFAGESVSAGSYRIYAVPNADSWEISLNSALGEWGYSEPDYSLDVLKVNVPVQSTSEETEQLTITFENSTDGANMNIKWGKTLVSIPITK